MSIHDLDQNRFLALEPFEAMIETNEFLPVSYLDKGLIRQRAVARVKMGSKFASGFLVSSSLFLTNNHVISTQGQIQNSTFEFNYQKDIHGDVQSTDSYTASEDVFITSDKNDLDYTLIKLNNNPGDKWGYIQLNKNPQYKKGSFCNIIQHPDGRYKEISIQENRLTKIFAKYIRYFTDTETGSSGSPVFNNEWDLISLHHAFGDTTQDSFGLDIYVNNEGIRIDALIEDLVTKLNNISNGESIKRELGLS
ncbi:trypsin-like serine peptidase [Candidatus Nitrosocosmicus oleophilus]|nr:serine protease [Candidatus Nitrosocosmicus oleophilus]